MRLLAFASVLAVQGLVSASAHYPKIVQWERTENETFVSQPNVLNGVDHVTVGIVDANPRRGEIHLYTDREIGNKVHECVEDDRNLQPKLEVIKPDLPGAFMCGGNKTMYVIPVIHVQLDRFFNVSLDFLRLRSIDGNLKFIHHHNLPPGLTFEATPSGIVCVSGIVRRGAGTLVSRLTFRSPTGNALYRIKIILHVKESEPKPNQTRVEIDMVPNRIDSSVSDIQQQIRAVKCAASALSLNPWDLYGVNSEKHFVSFLKLQAYFEFTERSCVPDPKKPKRCDDFSITRIDSNQPRCNVLATNGHLDRKPETMETTEKNESEEIETGTESVVRISNNEIVSSAPISTTATTPKQDADVSETPKQDANVSEIPKHVADVSETPKNVADASETSKNDADVSEEPKSVDSESDSGVRSDSIPPTLLQNEVSNRILDDPNLKTALYGMIGLAATVGAIIFLFLCSKLELCKKEAGYDPVFMARISDDNGKFA